MGAIGHENAYGVRVDSARRLPELFEVLRAATEEAATDVDPDALQGDLLLGADAACDADLADTDELSDLVLRIETLKPFGHAFPEPSFEIRLDPGTLRVTRMGTEKQHLRLTSRTGVSCLWWNAAEEHFDRLHSITANAQVHPQKTLRFLGKLQLNTFRGNTRLQVVVKDEILPAPTGDGLDLVLPDGDVANLLAL
jgi:single-stranded-DNA-specific exonuclease